MYVTEINIYQTYNPDQVVKVELIDSTAGYHEVYHGVPEAVDECPCFAEIPVIDGHIHFPYARLAGNVLAVMETVGLIRVNLVSADLL